MAKPRTEETGVRDSSPHTPSTPLDEGVAPISGKATQIWRPVALLVVIAVLILSSVHFGLGQKVDQLRDWIQSLGPLGPFAFALIYAIAVVAAVPGSALTILAGALFGSWIGILVVSCGATLGATLAFLIARYFARRSVSHWLGRSPRFRQLDEMTEKYGATIVALTRLVPLFPFNLLNYGFGLTRVRLSTYVFWSWLCMLPATIVFVVGADAIARAVSAGEIPWIPVIITAVAALALAILIRFARRRLRADSTETSHG